MSEQESPGPQLRIERIYLKDASFESPRTPAVFAEAWRPEIKVDINTRASRVDDQRHEVVLRVTVEATTDAGVDMIAEVQQAGLFAIEGLADDALRRVLGITCPTTLFPYVREALDALVVKGGFPPLNMAPINFEAVWAQAAERAAAGETTTH